MFSISIRPTITDTFKLGLHVNIDENGEDYFSGTFLYGEKFTTANLKFMFSDLDQRFLKGQRKLTVESYSALVAWQSGLMRAFADMNDAHAAVKSA